MLRQYLEQYYIIIHHSYMYKLVGCENLIIITWCEIQIETLINVVHVKVICHNMVDF